MPRQNVSSDIDLDTARAFERIIPGRGAKAWFIRECFERFVELYEEGDYDRPPDVVDFLVRDVAEDL